jgi:hypothetical protein
MKTTHNEMWICKKEIRDLKEMRKQDVKQDVKEDVKQILTICNLHQRPSSSFVCERFFQIFPTVQRARFMQGMLLRSKHDGLLQTLMKNKEMKQDVK